MLLPADQALLDAVLAGPGEAQRRAAAKAITLLESTRADHRRRPRAADRLPQPREPAFRVGVSAFPGGQSTSSSRSACTHRARPARRVLAVDPTRAVRRLDLGDKTRIERLSSPARVRAAEPDGGPLAVSRRPRAGDALVERRSYGVVIVETVAWPERGAFAAMTDFLLCSCQRRRRARRSISAVDLLLVDPPSSQATSTRGRCPRRRPVASPAARTPALRSALTPAMASARSLPAGGRRGTSRASRRSEASGAGWAPAFAGRAWLWDGSTPACPAFPRTRMCVRAWPRLSRRRRRPAAGVGTAVASRCLRRYGAPIVGATLPRAHD